MLVAKQVADLITTTRALFSFLLAWIGFMQGEAGLVLAVWIMVLDWSGDLADGVIARRSRVQYRTWIGDHDLEVDMLVSIGLFVYMLAAEYWGLVQAALYLVLWLFILWHWGIMRSLGMLFQAPIYGWFIWVALREQFVAGLGIVLWIVVIVVLTWPKFPQMVVPGFLKGMRDVIESQKHKDTE